MRRHAGHGGPPRDSAELETRGAGGGHDATALAAVRGSLEGIERNAILDGLARAHGNKVRAAAPRADTLFNSRAWSVIASRSLETEP